MIFEVTDGHRNVPDKLLEFYILNAEIEKLVGHIAVVSAVSFRHSS